MSVIYVCLFFQTVKKIFQEYFNHQFTEEVRWVRPWQKSTNSLESNSFCVSSLPLAHLCSRIAPAEPATHPGEDTISRAGFNTDQWQLPTLSSFTGSTIMFQAFVFHTPVSPFRSFSFQGLSLGKRRWILMKREDSPAQLLCQAEPFGTQQQCVQWSQQMERKQPSWVNLGPRPKDHRGSNVQNQPDERKVVLMFEGVAVLPGGLSLAQNSTLQSV